MLSELLLVGILGVMPQPHTHAFSVDTELASDKLRPAGIRKLTFEALVITQAYVAEPNTVEVIGHGFRVYGYQVYNKPSMILEAKKIGDQTTVNLQVEDVGTAQFFFIGDRLEYRQVDPGVVAIMQALEDALQQIKLIPAPRDASSKAGWDGVGIAISTTAGIITVAWTCAVSGGVPCAGAAIVYLGIMIVNVNKLDDRVDAIAREEREAIERARMEALEKKVTGLEDKLAKLEGPQGADTDDCPPGKECPPMTAANPGMSSGGISVWPPNLGESTSYCYDSDGDGDEDTCVTSAPRPK